MPVIDLTRVSAPAATSALDGAPRRIGLTLVELQYAARLAGDAPLPFEVAARRHPEGGAGGGIESRLGRSPQATDDDAFRTAIARLRDPESSLERRGLVSGGDLDAGVAGAIGLLATPQVALDLELTMGNPPLAHLKAWHRFRAGAVAALATVDGLLFELSWFRPDDWAGELGRIPVLTGDLREAPSQVPAVLDLPYELADAAAEAVRTGRTELLDFLLSRDGEPVLADGIALPAAQAATVLAALSNEAQGRLQGLLARIDGTLPERAGVVSWTLLADGWHAVRPHRDGTGLRVEIRRVEPEDLGAVLSPALAEAAR